MTITPRLHFCPLDRECRQVAKETGGATMAWRLELRIRRHTIGVALRPGDRYIERPTAGTEPGRWRRHWINIGAVQ